MMRAPLQAIGHRFKPCTAHCHARNSPGASLSIHLHHPVSSPGYWVCLSFVLNRSGLGSTVEFRALRDALVCKSHQEHGFLRPAFLRRIPQRRIRLGAYLGGAAVATGCEAGLLLVSSTVHDVTVVDELIGLSD